MKAIVFGSLNIDKVYSVSALPDKGETVTCVDLNIKVGGKGLNQAVSLKKAGADVKLAGCVGEDCDELIDFLNSCRVDTSLINKLASNTGHCIIQVDPQGKNQMILYPGANRLIDESYCDKVLAQIEEGDLLLMQYETSCVEYMAREGKKRGAVVAFNPSPYVPHLQSFPYETVDYLILNEYEGRQLTGKECPKDIIASLLKINPGMSVVLTLGGDGSIFANADCEIFEPALKVNAVDTTCAGDTFTGYFLKTFLSERNAERALKTATCASSLAVTKIGAAQTIPDIKDVLGSL